MGTLPTLHVRLTVPREGFQLAVDFKTSSRVTGIFGPSGAGKSSLLQAIAGIERQARGRISLDEQVWLDEDAGINVAPEGRDIGYVPQDGLLFPHLNVRGNLLAGDARARRHGGAEAVPFATVCALLELDPLLERDVGTLSGGERQRVALGRALCSGPRLLLLDEPLASLDLGLRRRVLPLLRRVRDALRVPMLLVSHDPAEIQALCDEVIALRHGTVLTTGPARAVLTDPRVFALHGQESFENLLPATLVGDDGALSAVRLDGDDAEVVMMIPRLDAAPGAALMVALPAREITVATHALKGISARNLLPARLIAVARVGTRRLLTVSLGGTIPELAVEVTPQACAALDLTAGRDVFLIIKATACTPYPPLATASSAASGLL